MMYDNHIEDMTGKKECKVVAPAEANRKVFSSYFPSKLYRSWDCALARGKSILLSFLPGPWTPERLVSVGTTAA